ncbi:hypothetical protein BJX70DRAFT_179462 [Aspergillus crustosus]
MMILTSLVLAGMPSFEEREGEPCRISKSKQRHEGQIFSLRFWKRCEIANIRQTAPRGQGQLSMVVLETYTPYIPAFEGSWPPMLLIFSDINTPSYASLKTDFFQPAFYYIQSRTRFDPDTIDLHMALLARLCSACVKIRVDSSRFCFCCRPDSVTSIPT